MDRNRELDNNNEFQLEGRHAVREAFDAEKPVDRIFVQKGLNDGPISTIIREAKKVGTLIDFVPKERLDMMSDTGKHQGVIAKVSAFAYSTVDDMFDLAEKKGESPFIFILDGIEDPHNLGAIIRTANLAGAHGVIIQKRRAVGITATVVKASAGAIHYTPVAKVTNISNTMEELKERGLWFACADMDGEIIYDQNLTGSLGIVIGKEGKGVSRLVKEHCDFVSRIPMFGDIDSLNASVAAGVMAFEVVRQRLARKSSL